MVEKLWKAFLGAVRLVSGAKEGAESAVVAAGVPSVAKATLKMLVLCTS